MFSEIRPEIQELLDLGVTVVKGEVEETWGEILADALRERLKPVYDFMDRKPDLYDKPVPMIHPAYLKRFMTSNFGTIDCSRGCPCNCSFCTIINEEEKLFPHNRTAQRCAELIQAQRRLARRRFL